MRHAPYSTFTDATPVPAGGTPRPGAAVRLWAGLLRLLALPLRLAAIRRDMALLGRMSGRELADIGLTRQDVCDAAALRLGEAPGPLFARRVAERRQAKRALQP